MEKRLKECQDAQENILRAIEGGVVTRSLPERLQKLENEQAALESEIKFQTSLKDPIITAEQIEYMLTRFADPLPEEDVPQWHRRMIEAFVAKVWLYDDKLSIYYNLMGNGDELQKNDMEIAADGNKLSVRFVSGMVEQMRGVSFHTRPFSTSRMGWQQFSFATMDRAAIISR